MSVSPDHSMATNLAKGLPKLRDVIQAKRGIVPVLGGSASHIELIWGFSERATKEQVFIMKVKGNEFVVSKQAMEHFLRAV